MSKSKKYFSIVVLVFIFILMIYSIKNSGVLNFEYIQSIVENSGMWAPIVFGLIYILITIFGISAALFTVLAGTIFGTFNGLVIVVISATISATIAFYIARIFRQNFLENKVDKKEQKNKSFLKKTMSKIDKT